jgi:uncharacterized protein (TIGR03437 family)
VNAASYSGAALAPNAIASIFGTSLSYGTESATVLVDGGLPISLAGVTVYVDGQPAGLFYVSATQINFLIPNDQTPGAVTLAVVREGVAGSPVTILLNETGPGLFQDANYNAIATHLDGSLISSSTPANPGEWVVLYAAGLGRTVPDAQNYSPAAGAALIQNMSTFSVLIDGMAVDASAVEYAGLAPGYAGLYQINVQMPANLGANPEVRLAIGSNESVPKIYLPAV